MTAKKRYILVGAGGFGHHWCTKVLPAFGQAEPVAVVDPNPDALLHAMHWMKVPKERCYADIDQALACCQADFLILVIPPAFRESYIDLAIEHDLHVLCEKPLADTMEACCRIERKMNQAGLKLAVTSSHRFEQDKQSLRQLLAAKTYGPAHYLVSRLALQRRAGPRAYKPGHSQGIRFFMHTAMIHSLDTMRSLAAANAKRVYAQATTSKEGHSSGFALIKMENDVQALCEVSFNNAATLNGWSDEYVRAECEKATLILDQQKIVAISHLGFPLPRHAQLPLASQSHWDHDWLLKDFVDWIGGKVSDHPASLADHMLCSALTFAALESAESGMPVDVPSYLHQKRQETTP